MAKNEVRTTDPRNVAETFINTPISVYLVDGFIHLTLGVERPRLDTKSGHNFEVEKEVVVRLAMPASAALTIVNAVKASLSPAGQAPHNPPHVN